MDELAEDMDMNDLVYFKTRYDKFCGRWTFILDLRKYADNDHSKRTISKHFIEITTVEMLCWNQLSMKSIVLNIFIQSYKSSVYF